MATLTQPTQRRGKSVHHPNGVGDSALDNGLNADVVDIDGSYGPVSNAERAIAYRDKDELGMSMGMYGLPTSKVHFSCDPGEPHVHAKTVFTKNPSPGLSG